MIEKLNIFINTQFNYAKRFMDDRASFNAVWHNALGAVCFAQMVAETPEEYHAIGSLWSNEWEEKWESLYEKVRG